MNYYPLYQYFIYNGKVKPNSEFRISENIGGVYEVIRITSGVPLFLEEHLGRFSQSAVLAGKKIRFSKDQIADFIVELTVQNRILEGNILLSCKKYLKAFFIPHKYPEEKFYETGITCGLLKAERRNPNAKVFQTTVRLQADEMMEKCDLYEVLLVDSHNCITEGSRSNVFFVKDNILYTPPGEGVLLGITRQKVIRLAKDAGIPVRENDISLEELESFQASFITGTSPKVLPVSQIDALEFDPLNELVQQLREKYDALIEEYVRLNGNSVLNQPPSFS
jgi:branched-chain amino acid aminotransferase